MTIKIGINGLGRIGRCVVRALYENQTPQQVRGLELVAINGPAPVETHVHLLKYDSVHGRFATEVKAAGEDFFFPGKTVKLFHHKDPKQIPWGSMGVDLVLECSGKFNKRAEAAQHLESGAKKLLI